MEVDGFASIIEVLVGLNLLYAADIRPLTRVLQQFLAAPALYSLLKEINTQYFNEKTKDEIIAGSGDQQMQEYYVKFSRYIYLNNPNRLFEHWKHYFQPAFLASGLYCIVALVAMGLEKVININFFHFVYPFAFMVFVFITAGMLKTFSLGLIIRQQFKKDWVVGAFLFLSILTTGFMIIDFILFKECACTMFLFSECKWPVSIKLLFLFTPFLAHMFFVMRVFLHKIFTSNESYRLFGEYKKYSQKIIAEREAKAKKLRITSEKLRKLGEETLS